MLQPRLEHSTILIVVRGCHGEHAKDIVAVVKHSPEEDVPFLGGVTALIVAGVSHSRGRLNAYMITHAMKEKVNLVSRSIFACCFSTPVHYEGVLLVGLHCHRSSGARP